MSIDITVSAAWTADDLAAIQEHPDVTAIDTSSADALTVSTEFDTVKGKAVAGFLAKRFPGVPVKWSSPGPLY